MKVLYFAWLKTRIGVAEEQVSPPAEVRTVGALTEWLKQRSPGHAQAFAHNDTIRAAINQTFATSDQAIAEGDEIAFFPPVTGG